MLENEFNIQDFVKSFIDNDTSTYNIFLSRLMGEPKIYGMGKILPEI